MTDSLVAEDATADTPGVETETAEPEAETEITVPPVTVESLVKDIETWLEASSHRTMLDAREIRELQTLFLDVWGLLTSLS